MLKITFLPSLGIARDGSSLIYITSLRESQKVYVTYIHSLPRELELM